MLQATVLIEHRPRQVIKMLFRRISLIPPIARGWNPPRVLFGLCTQQSIQTISIINKPSRSSTILSESNYMMSNVCLRASNCAALLRNSSAFRYCIVIGFRVLCKQTGSGYLKGMSAYTSFLLIVFLHLCFYRSTQHSDDGAYIYGISGFRIIFF